MSRCVLLLREVWEGFSDDDPTTWLSGERVFQAEERQCKDPEARVKDKEGVGNRELLGSWLRDQ